MKQFNFLRGTLVAIVAVLGIGTAQAATISGTLNFGGEAIADPGPNLNDSGGLSFAGDALLVTFASGAFSLDGIVFGSNGSIASFMFNPLSPAPVEPLITIGSFSYTLQTVEVVDQSESFLVLAGTGVLSAAGFDDTAYAFSMSVDGVGSNYAYSGTLGPVPIPGALVLFMSALAALGIRRRD